MKVTLDLPEALASVLHQFQPKTARIIAAGLREMRAGAKERFPGLARVVEKLAELPSPEEVLALRPTPEMQTRLTELLQKNREGELSPDEQAEWKSYEWMEHLVRIAKTRAAAKLNPV